MRAVTAVLLALASVATAATDGVIERFQLDLQARLDEQGADREAIHRRLHQIRNSEAMVELIGRLDPEHRPRRILYLAAGAHLAPLALCELLPPAEECRLTLTEIDPGVQRPIDELLAELAAAGLLADLGTGSPIDGPAGSRRWRFRLADRPVTLDLRVADASRQPPLLTPSLLAGADLVISHDWSGDQIVNLRLLRDFLLAARQLKMGPAPMLMMEDLERHPYPIDLTVFSPLARSAEAYGHRASDSGVGRHGELELGVPLYGGAVLLGFTDGWWRQVDEETISGVLDLLVFSAFDNERQNVLEGGDEPLLAPALLDWATGYGSRSVAGADVIAEPSLKIAMLRAAAETIRLASPPLRQELGCRLQLYRCLLRSRAAGGDIRELMPSARWPRRPEPGSFPSAEMETLYRQAVRRAGAYREAKRLEIERAVELLELLETPEMLELLSSCPVDDPGPDDDAAAAWAEAYRALAARLGVV